MQDIIYDRRRFIKFTSVCVALLTVQCSANPLFQKSESNKLVDCKAFASSDPTLKALAQVAPFVKVKEKWTAEHLYEFLNALPNESLLLLKKELGLAKENDDLNTLQGKSKDVRDVQKYALWISSNIFTYKFHDETILNYHDLVTWVAQKNGSTPELITDGSTFTLERDIQKQLFAKIWDELKIPERKELLNNIISCNRLVTGIDIAATVSLTGATAITALSATVAFTGFAFYTTMSVTISTVAGFLGVTLPFAAYTGASSVVAFLSGPIGWTIAGVAALGGIALAGRADMHKTADFICRIHSLKAAALIEADMPEVDVFGK